MLKPLLILVAAGLAFAMAFSIRLHGSNPTEVAPEVPPAISAESTDAPPASGAALEHTTAEFAIANPAALSATEKMRAFPLRDGTWVPTLNGVTLQNHSVSGGMSKTPIVAIEHNAATGFDYYLHADGSHTYTMPVENLVTGETHGALLHKQPSTENMRLKQVGGGNPQRMPAGRAVHRPRVPGGR